LEDLPLRSPKRPFFSFSLPSFSFDRGEELLVVFLFGSMEFIDECDASDRLPEEDKGDGEGFVK
jgi:hypothetical protein